MGDKLLLLGKDENSLIHKRKEVVAKAFRAASFEITEHPTPDCKLCLALGGDGSLLAAIRELGEFRHRIPILGIHGSRGLGFLHSIQYPEDESSLSHWLESLVSTVSDQQYHLEERWGLTALIHRNQKEQSIWAMNDLVISKGHLSRLVNLNVHVDGNLLYSNLKGDGLILSTATGSTAYSLSAGGPVLEPKVKSFVLTPISPHRIAQRPIVFNKRSKVQIENISDRSSCFLTSDGQMGMELEEKDSVTVRQAEEPVLWVHPANPALSPKNYYQTLRSKLGFGGDQDNGPATKS